MGGEEEGMGSTLSIISLGILGGKGEMLRMSQIQMVWISWRAVFLKFTAYSSASSHTPKLNFPLQHAPFCPRLSHTSPIKKIHSSTQEK